LKRIRQTFEGLHGYGGSNSCLAARPIAGGEASAAVEQKKIKSQRSTWFSAKFTRDKRHLNKNFTSFA
jgi:hypothetical protein